MGKTITIDKAIETFKLAVCPKICMIKGPKSDKECIARVDKCLKKDGGCKAYKTFVEKLNSNV